MADKIDREWLKELTRPNPSFGRALFQTQKYDYARSFIFFLLFAATKILIPITLGWFIDWFAKNDTLWVIIVGYQE